MKPRDPAPYVESAREVVIEESVTLAPMSFHLSRGECPHCGGKVRVSLEKVVEGEVLPMPEKAP